MSGELPFVADISPAGVIAMAYEKQGISAAGIGPDGNPSDVTVYAHSLEISVLRAPSLHIGSGSTGWDTYELQTAVKTQAYLGNVFIPSLCDGAYEIWWQALEGFAPTALICLPNGTWALSVSRGANVFLYAGYSCSQAPGIPVTTGGWASGFYPGGNRNDFWVSYSEAPRLGDWTKTIAGFEQTASTPYTVADVWPLPWNSGEACGYKWIFDAVQFWYLSAQGLKGDPTGNTLVPDLSYTAGLIGTLNGGYDNTFVVPPFGYSAAASGGATTAGFRVPYFRLAGVRSLPYFDVGWEWAFRSVPTMAGTWTGSQWGVMFTAGGIVDTRAQYYWVTASDFRQLPVATIGAGNIIAGFPTAANTDALSFPVAIVNAGGGMLVGLAYEPADVSPPTDGIYMSGLSLYAFRSFDGGKSWNMDTSYAANFPSPMDCPPRLLAHESKVYAVWLDSSGNPQMLCSLDFGLTWS
jgi:hypothetical protein